MGGGARLGARARAFTRETPLRATVRGMRILQITDTHLYGDPAARHYDRIDTGAALTGLLDRLGALEAVDAVVHTGDASEDGSEESYRRPHAAAPWSPSAGRWGSRWATTT